MSGPAGRDRGIAPLPPGLRIATMGPRLGAWLIDALILGGFQIGFWMLAVVVGAVTINPAAEHQIQSSPLTLPSVTPYQVNLPVLGVMLAGFVVLNVAYATISWAFFRGLPGQRLLSLQVGDAASGRNLSIGRALVRSILLLGIPLGATAGLFYGLFEFETSVPWSEVTNPVPGSAADAWLTRWSTPLGLAVLLVTVWPVIVLVTTGLSRTHQGLHDRAAGSLVVGKAARGSWNARYWSAYGPAGYGVGIASPPGPPSAYGPPPATGTPPPFPGAGAPADGVRPGEAGPAASPEGGPELPPPTGLWVDPNRTGTGPSSRSEGGPAWPAVGEAEPKPAIRTTAIGRRVTAYLLDSALVYTLFVFTSSFVTATFIPSAATNADDRTLILLGLAGGLEQLAYFVVGWTVWRGSLSQRLMHIQVGQVATGKSIGWMDALTRWAVLQGPFALMTIVPSSWRILVLVAAAGWSAFLLYATATDAELRGPHDRFLGSRVVDDGA